MFIRENESDSEEEEKTKTRSRNRDDEDEDEDSNKPQKLRVTMVGWNIDDTLVMTAISDSSLKVWDSFTGRVLYRLKVCLNSLLLAFILNIRKCFHIIKVQYYIIWN